MFLKFALTFLAVASLSSCATVKTLLPAKHQGPFRAEDGRCYYLTKAGGRIYDLAARC
jgi:hypothetical protein